jgi:hypothetical protein
MSELHFDELNDKVIKFMNDAGITPVKHAYSFNAAINRLVAVVIADEREACAKLCENASLYFIDDQASASYAADYCSNEIRARGEK